MSILIVGGSGCTGSQTAKGLAQVGLEPVVFDNLIHGHTWGGKSGGGWSRVTWRTGALISRVLELR